MMTGVYIGDHDQLKGRRGIAKPATPDVPGSTGYHVQFDDLDLGRLWTHGWCFVTHDCFVIENHKNLPFNVGGIA